MLPYLLHRLFCRKPVLVLCMAMVCWLLAHKSMAQYAEYELKAGILWFACDANTWKVEKVFATPTSKVVISIIGEDPFGDIIDRVFKGRPVKGRAVEIRRVRTVSEAIGSHLVFISRSEINTYREILNAIYQYSNHTVITVGDNIPNFCESGGMMRFGVINKPAHCFQLNLRAADGLALDSRFTRLASEVVPTEKK